VTARRDALSAEADLAGATGLASFYELHQEWPREVGQPLAEHLLSALGPPPRHCLFLGSATGVNDVVPFARLADLRDRVVGSDLEPAYLDRLAEHARRERLQNVVVRGLDVRKDLADLGSFDLVTLFFVIHRLSDWQSVVAPLVGLVGPRGSLYVSEFAGPSGVIYVSNEKGGGLSDPVSRMIRRYFELLPESFDPPLKSTSIGPVREALAQHLAPSGFRDFDWRQRITVGDMYTKIESKAYAPYFCTHPSPDVLDRLRREFKADWSRTVELSETIRIYRFVRT
jgi:ubiquinone/menaquinone biosynthesis C-methylase UbiE